MPQPAASGAGPVRPARPPRDSDGVWDAARAGGDGGRVRVVSRDARATPTPRRIVADHSTQPHGVGNAVRELVRLPKLPPPVHPGLVKEAEDRADAVGSRLADGITRFAGSMTFVYLHVIWFAAWIGFGVETYPYGLLTMIVSLEAIFLSTFVMISQNRGAAKQQAIADEEWQTVQEEHHQTRELLELSHQILALTRKVHTFTRAMSAPSDAP